MEIEEKNVVKWQKLKIEAQQATIDKLNKENEGLRKLKHVELLNDAKSQIILLENNVESWKFLNEKGNEAINHFKEENTKLIKGLNDIKSQLFDVNNCDTILTSTIEQLLKNK